MQKSFFWSCNAMQKSSFLLTLQWKNAEKLFLKLQCSAGNVGTESNCYAAEMVKLLISALGWHHQHLKQLWSLGSVNSVFGLTIPWCHWVTLYSVVDQIYVRLDFTVQAFITIKAFMPVDMILFKIRWTEGRVFEAETDRMDTSLYSSTC